MHLKWFSLDLPVTIRQRWKAFPTKLPDDFVTRPGLDHDWSWPTGQTPTDFPARWIEWNKFMELELLHQHQVPDHCRADYVSRTQGLVLKTVPTRDVLDKKWQTTATPTTWVAKGLQSLVARACACCRRGGNGRNRWHH